MINKSLIFAILLCLPFSQAISQHNYREFIADLSFEFNSKEVKKLEKSAQMLDEADLKLQQANAAYEKLEDVDIKERASDAYHAAMKLLFESASLNREAYSTAYGILSDKGESFWSDMEKMNHRPAGMDKAVYYERTAKKNMNRALIRHDQVIESDRFIYSLNIMNDAVSLDKLAVRNAGRSVQICMDYPVEYNYGWEDDKSLEEIVELLRDPNVNEPPEDIFATLDQDEDTGENEVDSTLFREIIFKVQIAAHTEPLTEEYLTTLYKGGLKIDLIYEEDWYKYSIGRYRNFDEAEATRRECQVQKAFVVAYREGVKIGTQEAIELTEK